MVATVGSISIDLITNIAKFIADFKKGATTVEQQSARMAKSIGGLERSMARMGGRLTSFVGGLAGGAAFAGLTSLSGIVSGIQNAVNQLDDTLDRAKTAGVGVELFQSISLTAKQAGVDVESVNSSLQFFVKGVGQAEQGTGRMFSAMQKLNPELLANILNAENQEERLRLVADAMEATTDATAKAALSQAAFGDVDFSRVLEGGSAVIAQNLELAKSTGQIFTQEQAEQNAKYADAMVLVSNATDVTVKSMLIELAPALVAVMDLTQDGAKAFGDYIKGIKETDQGIERFIKNPSFGTFMDFLDRQVDVSTTPGSLADFTADLFSNEMKFIDFLKKWTGATDAVGLSMDEVTEKIKAQEAEIKALQEDLSQGFDVKADITSAKQELFRLQQMRDTLAAGFVDMPVTLDASQAFATIDQIRQRTDALAAQFRAMDAAAAKAALPKVTRHTTTDAFDEIGGIPGALQGSAKSRGLGREGFMGFPGDVQVVIPKTVHNPYFDPTKLEYDVPKYDVPKRAAGGPVGAGGTYLVGEQGPELMRTGAAGNVSSASQTAGILSGAAAWIEQIEMHTYDSVDLLKSALNYLQTIESDQEASLAALGGIQAAIKDMEASATKYSAVGGTAGGVGGVSSDTAGGGGWGGGGSGYAFMAGRENYLYTANPRSFVGGLPPSSNVTPVGLSGADMPGSRLVTQQAAWDKKLAAEYAHTFASGGAIHAGDSQHVEFYKNPNETVEVLRPGQRSRYGGTSVGDINIYVTGDIGSRQSQLAMRDELYRAVSAAANRP